MFELYTRFSEKIRRGPLKSILLRMLFILLYTVRYFATESGSIMALMQDIL